MPQFLPIPNMSVSAVYIALIVLAVVPLIVRVILLRRSRLVSIGDHGHPDLALNIRIHGNYAENAPFIFALLLALPLVGASVWLIHIVGLAFLVGRVAHFLGLKNDRATSARAIGVMLTFFAFIVGSLGLLWRVLM